MNVLKMIAVNVFVKVSLLNRKSAHAKGHTALLCVLPIAAIVNVLVAVRQNMPVEINIPKIRYINYAEFIARKLLQSHDYPDYLANCEENWNKLRAKYGIDPINLTRDEYESYKQRIDIKKILSDSEFIVNSLEERIPSFINFIMPEKRTFPEYITVISFLKERFNGRTLRDAIAICLDIVDRKELLVVLLHEFVHWIHLKIEGKNSLGKMENTLIREGIASFVLRSFLNVSEADILNMSEFVWENCKRDESELKKGFDEILGKERLEKNVYQRDLTVTRDPFDHYINDPYSRYGYYLGYHFVLYCVEKKVKLYDIITKENIVRTLLNDYLAS